MITPRSTRIIRVPDLRRFRDAIGALACEGDPLEVRDRIVVVPTRAAASHLMRSIEERYLGKRGALLLPELVTRDELYERLADRLPSRPRLLTPVEREVILGAACRVAAGRGSPPPFRLRPGLISEILNFYDTLQRQQRDVAAFERLALDALEPNAESDRGAERLVRQTRFLVAAFREFERRSSGAGASDEHALRRVLLEQAPARPWRHVVLTVRDRAADPHGLWTADFDLLARLPRLERLDIVVTEATLAGAFHERLHQLFPDSEEGSSDAGADLPAFALRASAARRSFSGGGKVGPYESRDQSRVGACESPVLLIPPQSGFVHVTRDREEEVAAFARRVKRAAREASPPALDRMALVVQRPLPYAYVAREVLRSASIPCQMFDTLPLAAEPFAAALDLVFSFVASNFARTPTIALLRSPHFRFNVSAPEVAGLDRALSEAGHLGELAALESAAVPPAAAAARDVVLAVARELAGLRQPASVADHLDVLVTFFRRHQSHQPANDPLRARHLRARAAILGALTSLRDAHARWDQAPKEFDEVAAMVRRWIEAQTFAPRLGQSGVHVVDADSARYGDFDYVQLAGLVEGEWPERPRRNIFYSPALLRHLGWAAEADRIEGARAAFIDLLRLPSGRLVVSAFALEDDAIVAVSPLADELESTGISSVEEPAALPTRIFEYEALGLEPPRADVLTVPAAAWASLRLQTRMHDPLRYRGSTTGHQAPAYSVSALERYQDCPFKFFAADVLRLEEPLEDEPMLTPRARGRFVHEVFQRFFEEWGRRGDLSITPESLDEARALFAEVASPMLGRLPAVEASLERTRLFGSAITVGIVDLVLGLEASRPAAVKERWLEYRLDGEFSLGGPNGRQASLRGTADRIDLLEGHRLRVIDYKSGSAPNPKRALQVPIYALCAAERLAARDGRSWEVDEAAYVALTGKRTLVPVVRTGSADPAAALRAARDRLFEVLDGVARGDFPPRPHDPMICGYCAYASVCRKDYVGDE